MRSRAVSRINSGRCEQMQRSRRTWVLLSAGDTAMAVREWGGN
ncbi:MAG: hypothetical protein ACPGYT_14780 [Nitrospirales bacterium]